MNGAGIVIVFSNEIGTMDMTDLELNCKMIIKLIYNYVAVWIKISGNHTLPSF